MRTRKVVHTSAFAEDPREGLLSDPELLGCTVDFLVVPSPVLLRTSSAPSSGWWVILPWRLGDVHESVTHRLPGGIRAHSI